MHSAKKQPRPPLNRHLPVEVKEQIEALRDRTLTAGLKPREHAPLITLCSRNRKQAPT
jgi:hypothetical protein